MDNQFCLNSEECAKDHAFSTYAKFSEKQIFLTL